MSSRRPRSRFAAPLVLTLALAPACVIRTRTSTPPPGGRDAKQDHTGGTVTPIVNPPRPLPGDGTADNTPPPPDPTVGPIANPPPPDRVGPPTPPIKQTDPAIDVVQTGPNPTAAPTTWRVSQRADKSCYAMIDVHCQPAPATCNPPAPQKLASCPAGVTTTTSVTVQETSPGECFVIYDAPACPATMACNPPRPAKTACPR